MITRLQLREARQKYEANAEFRKRLYAITYVDVYILSGARFLFKIRINYGAQMYDTYEKIANKLNRDVNSLTLTYHGTVIKRSDSGVSLGITKRDIIFVHPPINLARCQKFYIQ